MRPEAPPQQEGQKRCRGLPTNKQQCIEHGMHARTPGRPAGLQLGACDTGLLLHPPDVVCAVPRVGSKQLDACQVRRVALDHLR